MGRGEGERKVGEAGGGEEKGAKEIPGPSLPLSLSRVVMASVHELPAWFGALSLSTSTLFNHPALSPARAD